MKLINKTIVLTGGTAGIGRQLVEQLADHNHVVVLGRDQTKLDELKAQWPSVATYQVDLSDVKQVHHVAKSIALTLPIVDVLVNNAAVQFMPKFNDKAFHVV